MDITYLCLCVCYSFDLIFCELEKFICTNRMTGAGFSVCLLLFFVLFFQIYGILFCVNNKNRIISSIISFSLWNTNWCLCCLLFLFVFTLIYFSSFFYKCNESECFSLESFCLPNDFNSVRSYTIPFHIAQKFATHHSDFVQLVYGSIVGWTECESKFLVLGANRVNCAQNIIRIVIHLDAIRQLQRA